MKNPLKTCVFRGKSFGAAGRIRTHDPLVRSQVLYPAELQLHKVLRQQHEIASGVAV